MGEIHFSNPNEPINLSSLPGCTPTEAGGWGCGWGRRKYEAVRVKKAKKKKRKEDAVPVFLHSFLAPAFTPLPSHLFPPLLLPKRLRVCVFLLLFFNAAHVCFSSGRLHNPEESWGGGGFYCSALMVFCV